jgi:hypothetical protein
VQKLWEKEKYGMKSAYSAMTSNETNKIIFTEIHNATVASIPYADRHLLVSNASIPAHNQEGMEEEAAVVHNFYNMSEKQAMALFSHFRNI